MALWRLNYFSTGIRRAKIILVVLFLAFIASALYFRSQDGQKYVLGKLLVLSSKNQAETKFLVPSQDLRLLEDSDKDGLKDWEEKIYSTNPDNPDTDGDETPDGQEIREKRDPLKPGPDDKLPEPEARQTSTEINGRHEENLTEDLSKLFLEEYLRRKNSGTGLNPKLFSEDLAASFLEGKTAEIKFPSVKTAELKISEDNSPEAVKKYFNTIASIAQKNLSGLPDPFFVFAETLRAGDITLLNDPALSAELTRFDPLIASYEKTAQELKETTVPKSFVKTHENAINIVLREHLMLRSFRDADQDIVKSLMMMQTREETMLQLQKYMTEVKFKLQASKISFNSDDPAKKVFGL